MSLLSHTTPTIKASDSINQTGVWPSHIALAAVLWQEPTSTTYRPTQLTQKTAALPSLQPRITPRYWQLTRWHPTFACILSLEVRQLMESHGPADILNSLMINVSCFWLTGLGLRLKARRNYNNFEGDRLIPMHDWSWVPFQKYFNVSRKLINVEINTHNIIRRLGGFHEN